MAQLFLLVCIPLLWTLFWLFWLPALRERTNRHEPWYFSMRRPPAEAELIPRWTPLRRMHAQRELDRFDELLNS